MDNDFIRGHRLESGICDDAMSDADKQTINEICETFAYYTDTDHFGQTKGDSVNTNTSNFYVVEEYDEIKTKLDVFQVDKICPKCGEGRMKPTGMVLMSDPPQYPHECNKCRHSEVYKKSYPCIEYEEIKMEAVMD